MTTVYDVSANLFIERLAQYLKENVDGVSPPVWAKYVKTGSHAERPPQNEDFWYIRAASLLRKLYVHGPDGVSRLRLEYGGRRRGKGRPEHFRRGGGSIIRKILQQLESAGLVKRINRKGRTITNEARSIMDKLAAEMVSSMFAQQKGE